LRHLSGVQQQTISGFGAQHIPSFMPKQHQFFRSALWPTTSEVQARQTVQESRILSPHS